MTCINFALAADRVFIATDTRVSGGARPEITSKILVLPHLRMLVAAMGVHSVARVWFAALMSGLPVGSNFLDIDSIAPDFLRRRWAGNEFPTQLFAFGAIDDEHVIARRYRSPSFESEVIPCGAWLTPYPEAWRALATTPLMGIADVQRAPPPPVLTRAQAGEDWQRQVRQCHDAARAQHREKPDSIAGVLQCAHFTPLDARQWWLSDLAEAPLV